MSKASIEERTNTSPEWPRSPISEICDVIRGVTYKKAQASDKPAKNRLPVLRATNIQDAHLVLDQDLVYVPSELISKKQKLIPGDIVVATSSGSKHLVGKTAQVREPWEGSFGAFCAAIRPKIDIAPKYLGYFFESPDYKKFIASRAMGVNINNLRRGDLEEISVPIAPRDQQDLIVAEIEKQFSRLDIATANLKRVKANLKRYKAAFLKAAVEGKLTEEWRKQNPDVEPASTLLERILADRRKKWEETELAKMKAKRKEPKDDKWKEKYKEPSTPMFQGSPPVPDGWEVASLAAVASALGGYAFKSKLFTESGAQVVKMANIKMGKLDLNARPSFIEDVPEDIASKYRLVDGDILVTLTGTRKKRDYGYVVQVREPKNILLLNQRIAKLRPYSKEISQYLAISLEGEEFRDRFFSHETGNVGQGNVGMKAVSEEYILMPSAAEQEEIVKEWQRMDSVVVELLAVCERQLLRANRLRQSILASAFSGPKAKAQSLAMKVGSEVEPVVESI